MPRPVVLSQALSLCLLLCSTLFPAGIRAEALPAQSGTAAPPVTEPEVFTYRQIGDHALKAYVFSPPTPGKAQPAILMFHGGVWKELRLDMAKRLLIVRMAHLTASQKLVCHL